MKKKKENKSLALFEIVFLILGIIAISYSIGSSFEVVSAQSHECVELYNSGAWGDPIYVPEGFTVAEYCASGVGTQCRAIECPNNQEQTESGTQEKEEETELPSIGEIAAIGKTAQSFLRPSTTPTPVRNIFEGKGLGLAGGTELPEGSIFGGGKIDLAGGTSGVAGEVAGVATSTTNAITAAREAAAAGKSGVSVAVAAQQAASRATAENVAIEVATANAMTEVAAAGGTAEEVLAAGEAAAAKAAEGPGAVASKVKGFFSGILATKEIGWGQILMNAGISAALYAYATPGLEKLGLPPHWARATGNAISTGYTVKSVALPMLDNIFGWALATGPSGWIIAGAFALFHFYKSFNQEQFKVITFSCNPWSPPKGGEDCELCNENELGCSEYQCRSLGASCELVNKGTTEELCTWINRNDILPPTIEPWTEILSPDYDYTPDNAISPPDKGVKIIGQNLKNGCIEAFFPIEFGVTLDEPGKCKIDPLRKDSFENMNQFFQSGSTYKYNHSQKLSLPSVSSLAAENITLINGGVMDFFVRCEDKNGYSNTATFSFNFCVDDGPDTTPPLIVGTDLTNGAPISFDKTSADINVYINEPAECKWDKLDRSYDDMENQMSCRNNLNKNQLYPCSTTLTGLKNQVDNKFYFRCEDQPELVETEDESKRNKNAQSYEFTLVGTQPLVISDFSPNGTTIRDSTDVIKVNLEVETSAGHNEGEALCSYKGFVEFIGTSSFQHAQPLYLPEGDYSYDIKCVGPGGNADNAIITFSVESDSEAPVVVRVYKEESSLKIITGEEAECVFGNFGCNYLFDDGTKMNSILDKEHFAEWDPDQSLYIKCRDEFLNGPLPNACSIEVRAFEG
jgi:hypothetical protein